MPHFLAIAWMFKEDYARGGFIMLTNLDESGHATGRQAVNYAFALLLVSLLPSLLGMVGVTYFFGAFILGAAMIGFAVRMQLAPGRTRARQLFFASILYLPCLLGLMRWTNCRRCSFRVEAMEVPPTTRRANRWLLLALVAFCIGLCAFCLLWMRQKVAADGGRVYPADGRRPSPA